MTTEADQVFGWAHRFSDRVHAIHELRQLSAQAFAMQHECGSCSRWMTSSCPRERKGDMSGFSRGPSSRDIKCDRFAMSPSTAATLEKTQREIAALRVKVAP